MTFSKKARFLLFLCIVFNTVLPMHTIKNFKNIKKNPNFHSTLFTKKAFKKFPKKFSSLSMHAHKQYKKYLGIGLGTGLFGYACYNVGYTTPLIKYIQNTTVDQSKKQKLIEQYAAQYKTILTEKNFAQADDNEKEIMMHAIIECIKKNKNSVFDEEKETIIINFALITLYLNDEQKKTFYTLYAQLLKDGHLDICLTLSLYKWANHDERKILLEGICPTIEKLENIEWMYIDQIYNNYSRDNNEEKKILDKAISRRLGIDKLNLKGTQSGGLLEHNIGKFYIKIFNNIENKRFFDAQPLKRVMIECLEQEIAYKKKEYDILYHGLTRKGAWNQWLYTELHRAKYKKNLDNYIFTRFMNDTTCQKNGSMLSKGKNSRKSLLEKGGYEDYSDLTSPRQSGNELMFTNHGISTYPEWPGKNSLWYCAANSNQKPSTITNQEIFALFGQEEFYLKNKKRIDMLEQQFITFPQGGVLLQIAFPQGFIEKYAYIANYDGSKRTINFLSNDIIKETTIKDLYNGIKIQKEATIKDLFNALKHNPETIIDRDKMEFVMTVTPDAIQKLGYKGTEIKMYDTAHSEETKKIFNELHQIIASLWANEHFETPYECYKKHYKN